MAKVGEDGKIVYNKETGEPEMITIGRAVATPTADTYPDCNFPFGYVGNNSSCMLPLGKKPNLKFITQYHYD